MECGRETWWLPKRSSAEGEPFHTRGSEGLYYVPLLIAVFSSLNKEASCAEDVIY
jgi:hypothetical protein